MPCLLVVALSSAPFPVEEKAEVKPDFLASNIIVCIAASVKTDQFKTLMKIESDCICIAGLCLKDDGASFLLECNFLCFIHQTLPEAFPSKRITHP